MFNPSKLLLIRNTERNLNFLKATLQSEEESKLVNPSASWPFDEKYWLNFFEMGTKTLSYFLKHENETIGHSVLKLDTNSKLWLCWVLVKHQYRGKGIANHLILKTEEFVKTDFEKDEYFLNVVKENKRAINFYNKLGFVKTESDNLAWFQMKKKL